MKDISLLELLKSGVHFGHQTGRWHPKMERYIFTSRNGVYIIDLEQTKALLERAYGFVRDTVAKGGDILFVATKRQAKTIVEDAAKRAGSPYVTERWIGGTFTNFETVSKQLKKLKKLKEERDSGAWEKKYKKHEQLVFTEEIERLEKLMGGFANLTKLPETVFIVDLRQEKTAVLEAQKVGMPIVAMVDTNVNPEYATYPIPANDDATKSIELIVNLMADAVLEGRAFAGQQATQQAAAQAAKASVPVEGEVKKA
ncbi:MAG: 30S ribosomal protein S2 [Patescibacteria group bacterium]|jgi:small subunit ribosomal protein S2